MQLTSGVSIRGTKEPEIAMHIAERTRSGRIGPGGLSEAARPGSVAAGLGRQVDDFRAARAGIAALPGSLRGPVWAGGSGRLEDRSGSRPGGLPGDDLSASHRGQAGTMRAAHRPGQRPGTDRIVRVR